jgi:regulator of RNase E activity RraA
MLLKESTFPRPSTNTIEVLTRASTATLTTILKRMNINKVWMPLKPFQPGMKAVGPALTIRCVPGREDLEPFVHTADTRFPRHPDDAIEAVQPGDVVVMDGRGSTIGAIFGDLLTQRIKVKGAAGLVSDMAVRDSSHLLEKEIPIFSRGTASPGSKMFCPDFNIPIGCAGVLVCPGDLIAADDDGVVVIPQSVIDQVVDKVLLFEDREVFIRLMLDRGESLEGLYPMGPQWEEQFQQWRAQQLNTAPTKS